MLVKTFTKKELIEIFTHYYELDLDNCLMPHEDWVETLASALTDEDYLVDFLLEYEGYLAEREIFDQTYVEKKLLKKYNKSTVAGVQIKHLITYPSGKVRIVNIDEDDVNGMEFYVDNDLDYTADYILCQLQNEPSINVSKY